MQFGTLRGDRTMYARILLQQDEGVNWIHLAQD
jgi:hypothetical protein